MADPYSGSDYGLLNPADHLVAITPSDTQTLATYLKGLYVGAPGNIKLQTPGDTSPVILYGVPSGTLLNVRIAQIFATSTTAGNLVGFY